jgi:hypothetical protein
VHIKGAPHLLTLPLLCKKVDSSCQVTSAEPQCALRLLLSVTHLSQLQQRTRRQLRTMMQSSKQ